MQSLQSHFQNIIKGTGKNLLLIRHGESDANIIGSLNGWTDTRLTEHGRKQAQTLYSGIYPFINNNKLLGIYSSDLQRANMTAQLSTLWTRDIQIDERLREIYFGEEEGEIYDQLPEEEKARINSIDYQPKQGESYRQVNRRVKKFIKTELFQDKQEGFYMLYTHGGLICCLTWEYGLKDVLGNCSVVGFQIDDKNDIKNIDLVWKFPENLVID